MDSRFEALYTELHRLARGQLARGGAWVSLGATTLLHEAYLQMAGRDAACFVERGRFMAYAARVMRGLIITHARRRHAEKRGGRLQITSFDSNVAGCDVDASELGRVSDAIDELTKVDRDLAELVDLKFFCGFSFGEIASMRAVSERTVQRSWEKARIFLYRAMSTSAESVA